MSKKSSGAAKASDGRQLIADNKKARHDYEIVHTHEAGIVLVGSEVKAIREGAVNLRESYIRMKSGELYLIGCHIMPYAFARQDSHNPTRDRKLLMHRREIDRLGVDLTQKGLTLVPLKLYFKDGRCKVEFAVGKGKKHFDKRDSIKKREAERRISRAMNRRR